MKLSEQNGERFDCRDRECFVQFVTNSSTQSHLSTLVIRTLLFVCRLPQSYTREQYEDILTFSTPPTDAETLAFLRKYDLKPSEAIRLYKTIMSSCGSSVAGD